MFPNSLPNSSSFPAAKAFVSGFPVAELSGHILPRISRSGLMEDGFDKHSIAGFWRGLLFSFDFDNQGINDIPKAVANEKTAR